METHKLIHTGKQGGGPGARPLAPVPGVPLPPPRVQGGDSCPPALQGRPFSECLVCPAFVGGPLPPKGQPTWTLQCPLLNFATLEQHPTPCSGRKAAVLLNLARATCPPACPVGRGPTLLVTRACVFLPVCVGSGQAVDVLRVRQEVRHRVYAAEARAAHARQSGGAELPAVRDQGVHQGLHEQTHPAQTPGGEPGRAHALPPHPHPHHTVTLARGSPLQTQDS